MAGSHLDTQPTGGKFDGVLGVLATLEVVRSLNDMGIKTKHPIEIAMWTNEEGSRFAPSMTASGVFAGAFTLDFARQIKDFDGKSIGDELDRIGYTGTETVGGRQVHAFFELHIEQGPILEEDGTDIGIVTAAQGQRWYEINIIGQDSHAGSTPMERRKDALLGAARLIDGVNRIGRMMMPDGRATCGVITVTPASRNVIPGSAFLTAEFRHPGRAVARHHGQESGATSPATWRRSWASRSTSSRSPSSRRKPSIRAASTPSAMRRRRRA